MQRQSDVAASIGMRAVDDFLERDIFVAFGVAADLAHLFEVVLGHEQVALLGMPHAVIGPGHHVIGVGGERLVVPVFGVVVTAKFSAGVADYRRHIRVVVIAHRAQRGDAALVVALVVDERVSGVVAGQEILGRAAFVLLGLLFCG